MLKPIAPGERNLPDDVIQLSRTLRENAPATRVTSRAPASGRESPARGSLLGVAGAPTTRAATESEVPVLDRWSVQAHVYTSEIAAGLGLFAGLFGGSGKRAKAGATHEATRYRVETTDGGTEVHVGVAVRLAVATTEWEVDVELSVPNIAAAAQLSMNVGDARIGIDVLGYSGVLGAILPAPRQLDVTTLADYLAAFDTIQRQVFGAEGLAFLTPTALSYDDSHTQENG